LGASIRLHTKKKIYHFGRFNPLKIKQEGERGEGAKHKTKEKKKFTTLGASIRLKSNEDEFN